MPFDSACCDLAFPSTFWLLRRGQAIASCNMNEPSVVSEKAISACRGSRDNAMEAALDADERQPAVWYV